MPESSQLMRLIPTSIGKKLKIRNTDPTNAKKLTIDEINSH